MQVIVFLVLLLALFGAEAFKVKRFGGIGPAGLQLSDYNDDSQDSSAATHGNLSR